MFPVLADTQHAKKMTRHGTAQTQCKKGKQGTTRNGNIGRMTRHGTDLQAIYIDTHGTARRCTTHDTARHDTQPSMTRHDTQPRKTRHDTQPHMEHFRKNKLPPKINT